MAQALEPPDCGIGRASGSEGTFESMRAVVFTDVRCKKISLTKFRSQLLEKDA